MIMVRAVVLLALAAGLRALEDYGPQKRRQAGRQQQRHAQPWGAMGNTESRHDERVISDAFREEVIEGRGCWWEGDNWEAAAECCGCNSCTKRDSRVPFLFARAVDPASARPRRQWMVRCCAWSGRWAGSCCPCNREYAQQP